MCSRPLSLASPWLSSVSLLIVFPLCVSVSMSRLPLFMRTLVVLDQSPPSRPYFNLITTVKSLSPIRSLSEVMGGVKTLTYLFYGEIIQHMPTPKPNPKKGELLCLLQRNQIHALGLRARLSLSKWSPEQNWFSVHEGEGHGYWAGNHQGLPRVPIPFTYKETGAQRGTWHISSHTASYDNPVRALSLIPC